MTESNPNAENPRDLLGFNKATRLVKLVSRSAEETERAGARLALAVPPNSVIALLGDLGAGKTCFARGFIRAMGLPEQIPVTSPTFVVVNTYNTKTPVFHFDWYRISDTEELEAVGYRDYLDAGGICIVEWPQHAPEAIPERTVFVHIHGISEIRMIDMYTTFSDPLRMQIRSALTQNPSEVPIPHETDVHNGGTPTKV